MEQIKKNERNSQPSKKDISPEPRKTTRPEIDLPLKGGRSDSDLASKNSPIRDDARRNEKHDNNERHDKNKSDRSTR